MLTWIESEMEILQVSPRYEASMVRKNPCGKNYV